MNELGEILKGERLKQSLTLQDVSDRTHVSVSMLQNLENGNLEHIGTPLLIRGFVRSYCSVLGMDPVPLLENYADRILGCDRMEQAIQQYGIWSRSFHKKNRLGVFAVLVLGMVVMGIIVGGAWLYNKRVRQSAQALKSATYPQQEFPPELREEASSALKSEESYGPPGTSNETHADIKEGKGSPPSSAAAPQESSAGKPSGAGSTGQPEVAPAEKALPSASTAGLEHQLEIEAEQKCWVKVVIDGTQTQEVTLEPGDKRAWSVREKLEIVLGNSSGVQLKWDGHPVKFTHPKGRVARLQLPDEKLINGPKTP